MIDIQKFCGNGDDLRYYLMKPFRVDGEIVATNGHIMIAIPDDGRHGPDPVSPKFADQVKKLLTATTETWVSMAEIEVPDAVVCTKCPDPARLAEDEECAICDGTGIVMWHEVKVGATNFNRAYLAMIKELPNAEIGISDKIQILAVPFRFDGGRGVVMPMRTK